MDKALTTQLANIEKRTGKSLEALGRLIRTSGLTKHGEIRDMLDTAESMKEIASREIKKVPTLRGKTVVNLFYEASTRTRTSFEIAGKWLSADVINFSASGSSADKGESLLDTARNIEAMSPDVVVVRHKAAGAPALLARHLRCGVINAVSIARVNSFQKGQ